MENNILIIDDDKDLCILLRDSLLKEDIYADISFNGFDGIKAINYELYMIEANYEDEEIKERIKRKKENGEYAYEYKVIKNHLSKAKCDDFIYKNAGALSEYVYLHCHCDEK